MAASLLSSERALGLHNRLARQLGKIAALLTGKLGGRQLAQDDALKAWESLRKLTKQLQETSSAEHLGRRQQDDLADRLRSTRKKLTAILE